MKRFATMAITLLLIGAFALPANAGSVEDKVVYLEMMNRYLQIADEVVEMASNKEQTTFLAIEGIIEIYQKQGQGEKAIAHLEKMLRTDPESRTVRNLVRLKLRDLYSEAGRQQEALAQLDAIIADNAK